MLSMGEKRRVLSIPIDRRVWPLAAVLFLLAFVSSQVFHPPWLGGFFLVLLAGHIAFFRDPRRKPEGEGFISPADGLITDIITVWESRYLQEEAVKIGIFLSVLNVHVNRAPMAGTVKYMQYVAGRFLNAMKSESSEHNESHWIGMENQNRRVMVRQIAGLIARRIRWDIKIGDFLENCQKFGIICYGSRVEIFMPVKQVRVLARIGQTVKAGQTLLGEFR